MKTKKIIMKQLSDKEFNTLENLHGYAAALGKSLEQLQQELAEGRLKWGELSKKGASYIVLEPVDSDDLIVADLYSIKFVTIYR
jgi:hypothetical protein